LLKPLPGGFDEARKWADQWDRLVLESTLPSPFSSFAWQETWWRHFGAKRQLRLYAFLDQGRLAGVAPLMKDRLRIKLAPVRRLSLVGTGLSDRLDFIYHKKGAKFVRALLERLTTEDSDWDLLELAEVPAQSPTVGLLRDLAAEFDLPLETRRQSQCPFLALSPQTLADLENANKSLTRARRRLSASGLVALQWAHQATNVAYIARIARAVDQTSYKAERGWSLWLNEADGAFLTEILEKFAPLGWLEFQALILDQRPIAYILSFALAGRVMAYTAAFDQSLARLSPGAYLTAQTIARALELGFTEFDLLRGEEDYKYTWARDQRDQLEIRIFNQTRIGRLYHRMRYERGSGGGEAGIEGVE
jgi:CelD/BcsL family acetyltransferase involved in cellulose biosynthesis